MMTNVDEVVMGNSFVDNFFDVLHCLTKELCSAVAKPNSGFALSVVVGVLLSIGGIILCASAIGYVLEKKKYADRKRATPPGQRYPTTQVKKSRLENTFLLGLLLIPCAWIYLFFTYAVPLAAGSNYLWWMLQVPILTLIMMVGPIAIAAYTIFLVGNIQGSFTILPPVWWKRLLLLVAATAILIGWRYLYVTVPEISQGPFGQGSDFAIQLMDTPSVYLPLTIIWWVLSALTSIIVIVAFIGLSIASMFLMSTTSNSATTRSVETATGNMVAITVGTVLSIVIGVVGFAVLLLMAMAMFLYVMAYALALWILGSIVVGLVRKYE